MDAIEVSSKEELFTPEKCMNCVEKSNNIIILPLYVRMCTHTRYVQPCTCVQIEIKTSMQSAYIAQSNRNTSHNNYNIVIIMIL